MTKRLTARYCACLKLAPNHVVPIRWRRNSPRHPSMSLETNREIKDTSSARAFQAKMISLYSFLCDRAGVLLQRKDRRSHCGPVVQHGRLDVVGAERDSPFFDIGRRALIEGHSPAGFELPPAALSP